MKLFLIPLLLVNLTTYAVKGPVAAEPQNAALNRESLKKNSFEFKPLGNLEIRPSYKSLSGEFHSEDSAFLGVQLNSNDSIVYKQEFNTNIYDPKLNEAQNGLNAFLTDGYLKEKLNNLYSNGNFSLSYEGRQYVPTWSVRKQAGLITAVRNYAKLKYQASPSLLLTFEEVPVLHVYQQSGSVTSKGPVANPIFENRASVGFEYTFSDRLKLSVPLLLSDVRTRSYDPSALNNSRWLHKVWVNPEIFYTVSSNIMLGMGFYSENLIKNNDFTDSALGAGVEQGTTQFIFSTSL